MHEQWNVVRIQIARDEQCASEMRTLHPAHMLHISKFLYDIFIFFRSVFGEMLDEFIGVVAGCDDTHSVQRCGA